MSSKIVTMETEKALNLANKLKKSRIAVTCCDAGSANIIFDLLYALNLKNFKICLEGPAINICKKIFPNKKNLDKKAFLDETDILISGTSWSSEIEHNIRKMASVRGIEIIATLDHWVNYRERFNFNNETILPDEIWVFDNYALNIANMEFKNIPIKLHKNYYLENQVNIIKNKNNLHKLEKKKVLYVLEPIRKKWLPNETQSGEFQALNFFMNNLAILNITLDTELILRLHPSEKKEKYVEWLNSTKFESKRIEGADVPIPNHMSEANLVLGCDSFMLVLASLAGKKVVSTLPPWAPLSSLPHSEITHLRNQSGIFI